MVHESYQLLTKFTSLDVCVPSESVLPNTRSSQLPHHLYRRWARGEAPTSADVTPLPQPRSFPFPTTYTEDGLVGEVRVSFPTTYTEDGLVGVFIWMNVR